MVSRDSFQVFWNLKLQLRMRQRGDERVQTVILYWKKKLKNCFVKFFSAFVNIYNSTPLNLCNFVFPFNVVQTLDSVWAVSFKGLKYTMDTPATMPSLILVLLLKIPLSILLHLEGPLSLQNVHWVCLIPWRQNTLVAKQSHGRIWPHGFISQFCFLLTFQCRQVNLSKPQFICLINIDANDCNV